MDVFTPPKPPSVETSASIKFRVLDTKFGDGYSQRARDGLNSRNAEVSVSWAALTIEEAEQITAFLDEKAGSTAFLWQSPLGQSLDKWVCQSYTGGFPGGSLRSITAEFRKVFDL